MCDDNQRLDTENPRQFIPVSSSPSGASVTIDGTGGYTTPCVVALKRKQNHIIIVEKPGYQSVTLQMTRSLSGVVAGNIIAGGFIGWGIDALTGAQNKFTQSAITVTLLPNESPNGVSPLPVVHTLTQKLAELDRLKELGQISTTEYDNARSSALGITTTTQSELPTVTPANSESGEGKEVMITEPSDSSSEEDKPITP